MEAPLEKRKKKSSLNPFNVRPNKLCIENDSLKESNYINKDCLVHAIFVSPRTAATDAGRLWPLGTLYASLHSHLGDNSSPNINYLFNTFAVMMMMFFYDLSI